MNAKEVFRHVVDNSGLSRAELARSMGRTTSYFRNVLSRGSIPKLDTFAEITDAAGYDLLVRKRSTGEELVIDPPDISRKHDKTPSHVSTDITA